MYNLLPFYLCNLLPLTVDICWPWPVLTLNYGLYGPWHAWITHLDLCNLYSPWPVWPVLIWTCTDLDMCDHVLALTCVTLIYTDLDLYWPWPIWPVLTLTCVTCTHLDLCDLYSSWPMWPILTLTCVTCTHLDLCDLFSMSDGQIVLPQFHADGLVWHRCGSRCGLFGFPAPITSDSRWLFTVICILLRIIFSIRE